MLITRILPTEIRASAGISVLFRDQRGDRLPAIRVCGVAVDSPAEVGSASRARRQILGICPGALALRRPGVEGLKACSIGDGRRTERAEPGSIRRVEGGTGHWGCSRQPCFTLPCSKYRGMQPGVTGVMPSVAGILRGAVRLSQEKHDEAKQQVE